MIKPITRFARNDKTPLYKITLKKKGVIREGRVDGYLAFKDTNKHRLMKDLDNYCKDLKNKQS